VIRLAPSPLYNSFADCWDAVQALKEIAAARSYEKFEATPALVT
jgi:kynureninase